MAVKMLNTSHNSLLGERNQYFRTVDKDLEESIIKKKSAMPAVFSNVSNMIVSVMLGCGWTELIRY